MGVNNLRPDPYASLRLPEFRYWLVAASFSTLAGRALAITLGYQIYAVSQDPLALGLLGLVEAIPALSSSLFGGHYADRYDRKTIAVVTRTISVVAAVCLAFISLNVQALGLAAIYAVVFVASMVRGFGDPAVSAFEAQVIPRELYVNAATWSGSAGQATAILGPAVGGLVIGYLGVTASYVLIAVLFAGALLCVSLIKKKPMPPVQEEESVWASIAVGVRYVFKSPVLVGSMALDLFAVLFGGAIALLPVFASDILHVGPVGYGFLTAAPSVGALLAMMWATRRPPTRNAGRTLFIVVAGFGVSMIVFALSQNFFLSFFALGMSGLFDGVSMVIRETIMRLYSPENLRARIASVQWIFIGSSNEIGAFESGVAARLLGAVPAVWIGALVTLAVVGVTALLSPQLRELHLDPSYVPTLSEVEILEVEEGATV